MQHTHEEPSMEELSMEELSMEELSMGGGVANSRQDRMNKGLENSSPL
jgi:hypothetical protein